MFYSSFKSQLILNWKKEGFQPQAMSNNSGGGHFFGGHSAVYVL